MNAADAHVLTRLEAINNVMHKRAKKDYTKIKDHLPYWQQCLTDWHGENRDIFPITIRDYAYKNTPRDWAKKPPSRPIYSKRSLWPSVRRALT